MERQEVEKIITSYANDKLYLFTDRWDRWPGWENAEIIAKHLRHTAAFYDKSNPEKAMKCRNAADELIRRGG